MEGIVDCDEDIDENALNQFFSLHSPWQFLKPLTHTHME